MSTLRKILAATTRGVRYLFTPCDLCPYCSTQYDVGDHIECLRMQADR